MAITKIEMDEVQAFHDIFMRFIAVIDPDDTLFTKSLLFQRAEGILDNDRPLIVATVKVVPLHDDFLLINNKQMCNAIESIVDSAEDCNCSLVSLKKLTLDIQQAGYATDEFHFDMHFEKE